MAVLKATRNEPRVGVGDFTMDFRMGETYEVGDARGQVPERIANYLMSHGLLVDEHIADGPASSPAPDVSPTADPVVTELEDDE